jgi:membrane fusion protein (multidrug efflux system)
VNQDASTEARTGTNNLATIRWVALGAVIAITVVGAFAWWRYSELYPTTENAYTGSNIVRVASEVSGPVIYVYVRSDDRVKADDPLFDIDPTLYGAALRNMRAQFDAAAAASGTAADGLKAAADKLKEKRDALEDALSAYRTAKEAQKPDQPPSDAFTSAESKWDEALKAYKAAEDDFAKEQDKPLTVTTPTVKLRAASAGLETASHEFVKTHVTAPSDAAAWRHDSGRGTAIRHH